MPGPVTSRCNASSSRPPPQMSKRFGVDQADGALGHRHPPVVEVGRQRPHQLGLGDLTGGQPDDQRRSVRGRHDRHGVVADPLVDPVPDALRPDPEVVVRQLLAQVEHLGPVVLVDHGHPPHPFHHRYRQQGALEFDDTGLRRRDDHIDQLGRRLGPAVDRRSDRIRPTSQPPQQTDHHHLGHRPQLGHQQRQREAEHPSVPQSPDPHRKVGPGDAAPADPGHRESPCTAGPPTRPDRPATGYWSIAAGRWGWRWVHLRSLMARLQPLPSTAAPVT